MLIGCLYEDRHMLIESCDLQKQADNKRSQEDWECVIMDRANSL
jgi:hypothetical protein